MRSMAKELAPDKIRVNCIAPAWTETEMAAPSLDALGREDVAKTFPWAASGSPKSCRRDLLPALRPRLRSSPAPPSPWTAALTCAADDPFLVQ